MCTKFYVSCSGTIDVKTENNMAMIKDIFAKLDMSSQTVHSENVFDSFIVDFITPIQNNEDVKELERFVFDEFKRHHLKQLNFTMTLDYMDFHQLEVKYYGIFCWVLC